jgi:hypothetical protein
MLLRFKGGLSKISQASRAPNELGVHQLIYMASKRFSNSDEKGGDT